MNRILVYGGLGNQMFQYALFLSMKKERKDVRISFSDFFYQQHHNGFNLAEAFKLKLPFPHNFLCLILLRGGFFYKNKASRYFLRRFVKWYRKLYYVEYREKQEFEFDHDLFKQHSSLLIGTWQVESYFSGNRDLLLKAFAFNISLDDANRNIIEQINASTAVSIHVRRGDYVNSPYSASHSVIKDAKYYEAAIAYVNERVAKPHYFLFSDDMDWVKQNLRIPNCTYVEHNKEKQSYMDMYLMSLCQHNIISNSTFSWWGAWLNEHNNKIVIMPSRWLNNADASGIFPPAWVKIAV